MTHTVLDDPAALLHRRDELEALSTLVITAMDVPVDQVCLSLADGTASHDLKL